MKREGEDFQDTYPLAGDSRLPVLSEPDTPEAPEKEPRRPRAVPSGLQFLRELLTYRIG